jgi:hypothetical protein
MRRAGAGVCQRGRSTREVLRLFGGEFLPGLSVQGAPELDASTRSCLGRVSYTTFEIEFAPGVWQNVGPATFDFVVVDGGKEILGSATAPAGTGIAVPRRACRLVRVEPN